MRMDAVSNRAGLNECFIWTSDSFKRVRSLVSPKKIDGIHRLGELQIFTHLNTFLSFLLFVYFYIK